VENSRAVSGDKRAGETVDLLKTFYLGFAFGVHFSQVERRPVRVGEILINPRIMTNDETLNQAESTIDALESHLSALTEIAADAATARQTTEAVESEIAALHRNANGLEMKARSNRLRDLSATAELHRSDAKHLQAAVDDQKRRVVEAGGIARQATQAIWSAAHLQRRANGIDAIRTAFDLRKCPVTAEAATWNIFSPQPHGRPTIGLKRCGNCLVDSQLFAKWPKTRPTLIWRLSSPSRP
jgi:hypothetical protein